jgi:hypothetical protein
MEINQKIIQKINYLTSNDPNLGKFISAILHFESEENGWFKDQYNKLLEEYSEGREPNENSTN